MNNYNYYPNPLSLSIVLFIIHNPESRIHNPYPWSTVHKLTLWSSNHPSINPPDLTPSVTT